MDSCTFTSVSFVDCDHSNLTFNDSTFTNCTFERNLFVKTTFDNVQFIRCKFVEPDFTNATVRAKFVECMMISTTFKDADTVGMMFEKSTFRQKQPTPTVLTIPRRLSVLTQGQSSTPTPTQAPVTSVTPVTPVTISPSPTPVIITPNIIPMVVTPMPSEPPRVTPAKRVYPYDEDTTESESSEVETTPKKKQFRKYGSTCNVCGLVVRGDKYLTCHTARYKGLEYTCSDYMVKCPYCHYKNKLPPGRHIHLKHAMSCENIPDNERDLIIKNKKIADAMLEDDQFLRYTSNDH